MKGLNFVASTGTGSSLTGAFLERVQQTSQLAGLHHDNVPQYETPLVLALDQLRPNPDNPRTARNPLYDEIKQSIRARGLDTVPKVTKDPASKEDFYIFSDGGNTRHEILSELYEETHDERFNRIQCVFKPWPGRLKCLLGHLAENDLHGELTFIDRAKGILKARKLYEEEGIVRSLPLRELSSRLKQDGYPISPSEIQRMEYSLKWLYPAFPRLLDGGMGRPQARSLIRLHRTLSDVVDKNPGAIGNTDFNELFCATAARYDDPELWSFDVFEDELISALSEVSHYGSDWWKLIITDGGGNALSHIALPERQQDAPPLPKITELPPAEIPSAASADTAPGTEIRTAGLSLNELADAHHYDEEDGITSSDPRTSMDYREEQLALDTNNADATLPQSADDPQYIASDTRSVTRLRTQLLRQAFTLAELAGIPDCVVSDDSTDSCGFRITASDAADNTGIQAFLSALSTNNDTLPFPILWLAGDYQEQPANNEAFGLAASLLSGISNLRVQVRKQGSDSFAEEDSE